MTDINFNGELNHVCIVGCGLLGGSFALALRRAGFTGCITACGGSRSPKLAVERGVADALELSFDRGEVCEADLIYLAAPIGAIIDFLKTKSRLVKPGALITDAGIDAVSCVPSSHAVGRSQSRARIGRTRSAGKASSSEDSPRVPMSHRRPAARDVATRCPRA